MATREEIERIPVPDDVERYRATPLRPVVYMTIVLVWAMVVALILKVPVWASIFLCASTGISFLLFLVSYIYLFTNDREMLRAERSRRPRFRGNAPALESRDPTPLQLGGRGYPQVEQAASLVETMTEERVGSRSTNDSWRK
jgi:hypothetical protein